MAHRWRGFTAPGDIIGQPTPHQIALHRGSAMSAAPLVARSRAAALRSPCPGRAVARGMHGASPGDDVRGRLRGDCCRRLLAGPPGRGAALHGTALPRREPRLGGGKQCGGGEKPSASAPIPFRSPCPMGTRVLRGIGRADDQRLPAGHRQGDCVEHQRRLGHPGGHLQLASTRRTHPPNLNRDRFARRRRPGLSIIQNNLPEE